jgi:hypothetical protein
MISINREPTPTLTLRIASVQVLNLDYILPQYTRDDYYIPLSMCTDCPGIHLRPQNHHQNAHNNPPNPNNSLLHSLDAFPTRHPHLTPYNPPHPHPTSNSSPPDPLRPATRIPTPVNRDSLRPPRLALHPIPAHRPPPLSSISTRTRTQTRSSRNSLRLTIPAPCARCRLRPNPLARFPQRLHVRVPACDQGAGGADCDGGNEFPVGRKHEVYRGERGAGHFHP